MPLLADAGRKVIGEYRVAAFGIGVRRSVFVLDDASVVRWRHVGLIGVTYPSAATIAAQVSALSR